MRGYFHLINHMLHTTAAAGLTTEALLGKSDLWTESRSLLDTLKYDVLELRQYTASKYRVFASVWRFQLREKTEGSQPMSLRLIQTHKVYILRARDSEL